MQQQRKIRPENNKAMSHWSVFKASWPVQLQKSDSSRSFPLTESVADGSTPRHERLGKCADKRGRKRRKHGSRTDRGVLRANPDKSFCVQFSIDMRCVASGQDKIPRWFTGNSFLFETTWIFQLPKVPRRFSLAVVLVEGESFSSQGTVLCLIKTPYHHHFGFRETISGAKKILLLHCCNTSNILKLICNLPRTTFGFVPPC